MLSYKFFLVSLQRQQCQLAFTAGGGCGINEVKKVEMNVHVTCRTPGPAGSGGGACSVSMLLLVSAESVFCD